MATEAASVSDGRRMEATTSRRTFMKSIEQRIAEARQHGVDNGVPVAEFSEVFAEVKKNFPDQTDEQLGERKLSATLAVLKKHNIKESAPRVMRKNGTFFEGTTGEQDQVLDLMRESGMNFREANCLATGDVVKAGTPNPDYVKESIRQSWKEYLPQIDEGDLNTLVERGVWAPKV
jgi:hypothetical protein